MYGEKKILFPFVGAFKPICFKRVRRNISRTSNGLANLNPEGKEKGNGQLSLEQDLLYFSGEEAEVLPLAN